MNHDHVIAAHAAQPALEGSTPAILKGRLLNTARAAWLLFAALGVGMFLAGLPPAYRQLLETCTGSGCAYYQLSSEEMLALQDAGVSSGVYAAFNLALSTLSTLAYTGVAILIFRRRSNEWTGLLASLWLITLGTMNETSLALASGPALLPLWTFLDQLGWVILPPLFLFTFPNGRFVPRWTLWLYLAFMAFGLVGVLIEPANAYQQAPNPEFVVLIWLAVQLTGVIAQVYRYRRVSDAAQRQQTKWVVFGLVGTVLILTLYSALTPPEHLAKLVEVAAISVAFAIIPLSLGVAILRHRLWDIDVLVNRALVYGALTAIVLGSYALIVGGVGSLLHAEDNFWLSILATGLIAALFHPLQLRLQRAANRLMYGEREDPYAVLSQLGKRLETALTPRTVLPTIVETVAQTLKLPYVAITIKKGDVFKIATSSGAAVEAPLVLPLSYQGETIGQLICGRRGEAFQAQERSLLEDIARQAGVAAHALQLNADLQRSRQRLVIAREDERRRIRRDLHDGLGPVLASQTLTIGSARALLKRDPDAADALLQRIESENRAALLDIRRLVYNLRPPALDELGLLRAIQQAAPRHQDLSVTFELPATLPELSAAVEVAAFRIAQEALSNVVRHAGAGSVVVRIEARSEFCLTVSDDGQGLPGDYTAGVGLNSMRERAEELDGTFHIDSREGEGTTIEVRLPLDGEEA